MAKKNDYGYGKDKKKPQRGDSLYYLIGIVLVGVSVLVLFQSARVTASWYMWRMGGWYMPTGVSVVPMLIGIGMFFYKPGWLAAKIVIAVGVGFLLLTLLLSVRISFVGTSLFNYVLMFGTLAAGLGFLLRGLFARRE